MDDIKQCSCCEKQTLGTIIANTAHNSESIKRIEDDLNKVLSTINDHHIESIKHDDKLSSDISNLCTVVKNAADKWDKLDEQQEKVDSAISQINNDVTIMKQDIKTINDTIHTADDVHNDLTKRMTRIEKYYWIAYGFITLIVILYKFIGSWDDIQKFFTK